MGLGAYTLELQIKLFDERYNHMKSANKNIATFRQSLSKRGSTSRKGISQQSTARGPSESNTVLTKSTTLRLLSSKQPQTNNYMFDPRIIQTALKSNRAYPKKKPIKTIYRNIYEQMLLKNSDKMKLIFWNQDPSLSGLKPIIVSADFVINQDNLWQKPEEGKSGELRNGKQIQNLVKEWRALHKSSFVIWVVRNRCSWARLQSTITAANLPMHALFFLKRKKNYTVDYSCIVRELDRQREMACSLMENRTSNSLLGRVYEEQLNIFETVKVNLKDVVVYQSYRGKIPVLIGKSARVLLMRMDGDPPGLDCINRCLQKWKKPQSALEQTFNSSSKIERSDKIITSRRRIPELSICSAIPNFISKYLSEKIILERELSNAAFQNQEQDWFYDEQQIYASIDSMKRNLIETLVSDQGRHYQFEGGISIYNFVGEMFKRNYKILFQQIVESRYAEERQLRKKGRREKVEEQEDIQIDLKVEYYQFQ